jgi:ribonuclease HI
MTEHDHLWYLDGYRYGLYCKTDSSEALLILEMPQSSRTKNVPVLASFDGLCHPRNPGGCACGGWHIAGLPDGAEIRGSAFYIKGAGATNNIAEYRAATDALHAVSMTGWSGPVELRGDSQLVIRQFNGVYKVNRPHIAALLADLRDAADQFESVTAVWVPREENSIADAMSREAYYRETGELAE